VVVAGLSLAVTRPSQAANGAKALDLDQNTYGNTYGEWAARRWQWALSIPANSNPLLLDDRSPGGAHCDAGQSRPVWFLASSLFGGTFERSCAVPVGKALFFPVIQAIFGAGVFDCAPTNPGVLCNIATLRQAAFDSMDSVTLAATVDGKALRDLGAQRAQSPVMILTYPVGNALGVDSGTYLPNVADGYWVMLSPLSAGSHTITLSADITGGVFAGSSTRVTYHLTIGS